MNSPYRSPTSVLYDRRFYVLAVLLVAFVLRLAHVLLYQDWGAIYGGDYWWYADYGRTLVRTGWGAMPPQTGPLFLLIAGYAEEFAPAFGAGQPGWLLRDMVAGSRVFPDALGAGQPAIRLLHVFLGTLTVLMIYRIGRAAWNHPTGLVAAIATALNPMFIAEAGNTTTETLAVFLALWAFAIWMEHLESGGRRVLLATGILLALAALTRSVMLVLPIIFLTHLVIRRGWRRALRDGLILLAAFFLTISPWTLFNAIRWNHLTLTGEGVLGMLYVGAVGWKPPSELDAEMGFQGEEVSGITRDQSYTQGLIGVVLSDPAGYALRRIGELGGALLQPHNTNVFPGESIKRLLAHWLKQERTWSGLISLTATDYFWTKLLIYLFHYTGLILGVVGLLLFRRRWRELWPLYAVFAYFLGIHLLLSAIPRYLFPLEAFWWLFAAAILARWAEGRYQARRAAAIRL